MLTFTDTIKSFILLGDILKTMTNYDFNVDNSDPRDRKVNFEFGKEMKFTTKQKGRKSPRGESVIKLP